jgi:3-deoxy-D-arabino-heptulosonate 7-phosphate (DAHP) synthase
VRLLPSGFHAKPTRGAKSFEDGGNGVGYTGVAGKQKAGWSVGVNGGLVARRKLHHAIVDVSERRRDLVTHAVVQRKRRADAVLILCIGAQLPATQITREVAPGLGKYIRLAQQEVGHRVVGVALTVKEKVPEAKFDWYPLICVRRN